MTIEITSAPTAQLLRGRIGNLRKSRRNKDFFFTEDDRAKMGATAIAAGLAGLGGIATGLAGMSMDTTEEADLLAFDLDGKAIKAWVWCSVFKEGDDVEVVAEQLGDTWQAYGIRRTSDRIVALHPHCSRGRNAHYRSTIKWWLVISGIIIAIGSLIGAGIALIDEGVVSALSALMFFVFAGGGVFLLITGVIAYRISKKMMGFVRLAEGIFQGFGWKDIKNIDLPAVTKKDKTPDDPGPLGVLYFRY